MLSCFVFVIASSCLYIIVVISLSCLCLLLILVSLVLHAAVSFGFVLIWPSLSRRVGFNPRRSCLCPFPNRSLHDRQSNRLWSCPVPCCRLLSFVLRLCPSKVCELGAGTGPAVSTLLYSSLALSYLVLPSLV
jgi:hypothetical protein